MRGGRAPTSNPTWKVVTASDERGASVQLQYLITFVADMDAAVMFYRDTLGLTVRFQTPDWTELETGSTTLALHPASPAHPHGTTQVGFNVPDMAELGERLQRSGLKFTRPPHPEHGVLLAEFADAAGARYSVSAPMK
jgi:predicted enzyme related to lactoylglutathione lyase